MHGSIATARQHQAAAADVGRRVAADVVVEVGVDAVAAGAAVVAAADILNWVTANLDPVLRVG